MPQWLAIVCVPVRFHPSLDRRFQLGHPHSKSFHRDRLDARVEQRIAHEAMPLTLRPQWNVGDCRKLRAKRRPRGNASCRVGVKLAVRWSTRDAQCLRIASRAISLVTIVDPKGVSWKGKLRYAHRLLDAIPESSPFPNLRAVVANRRTGAWSADTVDLARWGNVLRV